jgi:3-hydroxyacyl-CoA dehydrogenase/enoyl-CoA hydratase/3-hydroxybutyryl-CoA epimerase
VVPIEGIEHAARLEAGRLADGGKLKRPSWPWLDTNPLGQAIVYSMARRSAMAQSHGHYPAPLAAIDAVRFGLKHGIDAGLKNEAEHVGRLLVGDVSKNLVGIFLASRSSGPGPSPAPAGPALLPIARVGVLGAGTMGGGIAAVAAMTAGVAVRLKDVNAEALARGMKQVRGLSRQSAVKGRLARHEAFRREALVSPTTGWAGFERCDLVIEAVVEDLAVKRQVLRDMEAATDPGAIFATNTSSLSVADIGAAAKRPGRVLGLHFFNPVEKMPLVEVILTPATEPGAVEAVVALARRMGKTPVVVKDTPGFIVNRILMPYLAGAIETLGRTGSAATVLEVDRAMVSFGMPMGPFALLDQIGIDVAAKVAGVLKEAFPHTPGDSRLLHAMMQTGLLGVKSGKGFYLYGGARGKPVKISPELARLLSATYRPPSDGAAAGIIGIDAFLIDSMINEAALLLEEGAVDRPEVIDLAMIFGAGFPPFRGGLLRHADKVGRETIAGRLAARGITPAPTLTRKGRFYE